jgi:hemoglobin
VSQPAPLNPESLYSRIGGREAVSAIVEAFYRRVEADEHLRPIYPDDLEPGKEKLKLFFEQWLGGPGTYTELYGHPRLRRRHFPFIIDERAAGRWLRNMREAWQEVGVADDIQAAVFEGLGPLAKHMVNAGEDVPREPLGDVQMQ